VGPVCGTRKGVLKNRSMGKGGGRKKLSASGEAGDPEGGPSNDVSHGQRGMYPSRKE